MAVDELDDLILDRLIEARIKAKPAGYNPQSVPDIDVSFNPTGQAGPQDVVPPGFRDRAAWEEWQAVEEKYRLAKQSIAGRYVTDPLKAAGGAAGHITGALVELPQKIADVYLNLKDMESFESQATPFDARHGDAPSPFTDAGTALKEAVPPPEDPESFMSVFGSLGGTVVTALPAAILGGPAAVGAMFAGSGMSEGISEAQQHPEASTWSRTGFVMGKSALGALMAGGPAGTAAKLAAESVFKEMGKSGLIMLLFTVGDQMNRQLTIDPNAKLDVEGMFKTTAAAMLLSGAVSKARSPKAETEVSPVKEPVQSAGQPLEAKPAEAVPEAGKPAVSEAQRVLDAEVARQALGDEMGTERGQQRDVPESAAKPAPAEPTPRPTEPPATAAATEAPIESSGKDAIGIKNSATEAQAAAFGVPPAKKGESIVVEPMFEAAAAKITEDPQAGARLIKDIAEKGRTPTPEEVPLMAVETVRLVNEVEAAGKAYEKDPTPDNLARSEAAEKAYTETADVLETAGTHQSQAFSLRQYMRKHDMSKAEMERQQVKRNRGEPVTEEQSARLKKIREDLEAATKELEIREAEYNERVASEEAQTVRRQPAFRQRLRVAAVEARGRLRQRLRSPSANIFLDPAVIKDLGIVAAEHIARGADVAVELVKEFGEEVRPHIEAIRAAALEHDAREIAATKRTEKTTDRLKEKSLYKDFSPLRKTKKELPKSKAHLEALAEKERINKVYKNLREHEEFQNRSKAARFLIKTHDLTLNLGRDIRTAYDLSAPLRQGLVFSLGRPIEGFAKPFAKSVHAAFSEAAAQRYDAEVKSRSGFGAGKQSGLHLNDLGHAPKDSETTIRSRYSEKIPGIRASNRAFNTFLNQQRSAMFDRLLGSAHDQSPEAARAYAHAVNVGTGYGEAKKLQGAMNVASEFLWSPRLLLSRMEILSAEPLWRGNAETRRKIATELYVRPLLSLMSLYAIARFAGAKVEDDPRSTDFGKIVIGDQHLDVTGGMARMLNMAAMTLTGEKKLSNGRIAKLRGKNVNPVTGGVVKQWVNWIRGKAAPTPGGIVDYLEGKNVVNEDVDLQSALTSMFIPMSPADVYEAFRAHGISKDDAFAFMTFLGIGVMTYDRR